MQPQRRMLQEAKTRRANIFEAFSNSPPYWMTVSGCASGNTVKQPDNPRPDMHESFVRSIEGAHQIVSQATKRCLNTNRNSTRSGEAIIPYPCDGLSNMEFNFVDQGGGFYSIHTVNGTGSLCLNISNATASPGDGKKYGGPGNSIQWNCAGGSLPANELFKVFDGGGDRVQIRVKSSGLGLEDPGRGGTLRQNLCNPSQANQEFILTE